MATVDDWVKAGFSVLASHGVDAVRVEPLAARLKVTKGSFYWHFADRRALLDAMLKQWESVATSSVITALEATPDDGQRLERLFAIASRNDEIAVLETSVRWWAALDEVAARAIAAVDARREKYVADLLQQRGVGAAEAKRRSHQLYLLLIGDYAARRAGAKKSSAADWATALRLFSTVD